MTGSESPPTLIRYSVAIGDEIHVLPLDVTESEAAALEVFLKDKDALSKVAKSPWGLPVPVDEASLSSRWEEAQNECIFRHEVPPAKLFLDIQASYAKQRREIACELVELLANEDRIAFAQHAMGPLQDNKMKSMDSWPIPAKSLAVSGAKARPGQDLLESYKDRIRNTLTRPMVDHLVEQTERLVRESMNGSVSGMSHDTALRSIQQYKKMALDLSGFKADLESRPLHEIPDTQSSGFPSEPGDLLRKLGELSLTTQMMPARIKGSTIWALMHKHLATSDAHQTPTLSQASPPALTQEVHGPRLAIRMGERSPEPDVPASIAPATTPPSIRVEPQSPESV